MTGQKIKFEKIHSFLTSVFEKMNNNISYTFRIALPVILTIQIISTRYFLVYIMQLYILIYKYIDCNCRTNYCIAQD